jgi:hypothetical protein
VSFISRHKIGSVREEIADIEDHIIVICKDLTNLKELILQLRARKNNWLKYIVVLSQEEIPPIIWQTLSIFEGILSVLGSPLEESDLVRAGVHSARQVLHYTFIYSFID